MHAVVVTSRPRSVLQMADPQVLATALELHAPSNPEILDVTWGRGQFWKGLHDRYCPVGNDVDPRRGEFHYDFRELPSEWTEAWDVVVFDPPGITEAGVKSRYYTTFGVGAPEFQHVPDNTHLFAPFLREAVRVLRPKGIIVAKIGDMVHRGIYRWQSQEFLNAVSATPGLIACDLLIKFEQRADTLVGHNWTTVRHSRRAHVNFFVVRKGRC